MRIAASSPIRFCLGALTSSKKVSQKGEEPLINTMGLVLTPGEAISNSKKEIPWCLGPLLSVRVRQKIQSA